ncbi:MAG: tetratricopeptide repeat protein, partial [Ginsengibacter sp.]
MNTTKFTFLLVISFVISSAAFAQAIPADNTALATKELTDLKTQLSKENLQSNGSDAKVLQRMLDVGMWSEAYKSIMSHQNALPEYQLLLADYFVLNNDFKEAENIINKVLEQNSGNQKAILTKAFLEIQAWHLSGAAAICENANKKNPSEKMELMLGRARLLQKDYTSALKIAKKILSVNPKSAGAYLLEADVYFWNQQPDKAEAPLKKSLEIDPFNADARFSYGYAIWRRIDATQLNAMAAQWELALALNPLHFQTHWHWGNGHTNLTYADYAEKNDDEVRNALMKADDEIRKNNVDGAIAITRQVEEKYPNSILPLMHRGSIYYEAFDMDRKTRLDSAGNIFETILQRKKHYGPAHNGLAAVIKSKRIPYLGTFDSISYILNHTKITDSVNFERVFSDAAYYPGNTVNVMIWNQMYAAVVYFPFLSKQNRNFHIPPLHIDLATAMNSSYFRFGTTFDNRQWMDIRGVGSGAAGIGYVERGAFGERNVVLHEYVHLFHGSVLTDDENRQIRALYYNAMKEKR